jgi:DNA-binding NtrC family response regulator
MRPYEVVMIDDDSDDLDFMQQAFSAIQKEEQFGIFRSASDFLYFINKLASPQEFPSIVLLDHNLAGDSGLQLVEKIKQVPSYTQMTFIVFTGSIRPREKTTLEKEGIIKCLLKPHTLAQYVKVAKHLIELSQQ